jgi:DNA-binding transcriptional MerR regulator
VAEIEMGDAREIPEKPFYKIGEVCQYTDTQPYVIRFWESEFPQLSPGKGRSGQRVYRREDIDLILRIKKLLYEEEYTIAGARRRLDEGPEEDPGVGPEIPVEEPAAPPISEDPAPAAPAPEDHPGDPDLLGELERLRSRLAASESERERSEARAEELARELELLGEGLQGKSPDLAQARLLAAEAARQAAERAVRIQRTKALEVADMLEELLARIDALDDGERSGEPTS